MAILKSAPLKDRSPSFSKRIMIDTVRGVLRVRKWPRKRGTPTAEKQIFWIDWFRQANLLYKYIDAWSVRRSMEITKGTPMYPRDVVLKAMRGRLYIWITPDGWRWFPMAAIGDISETLDVLAQTIGSVLVRATDRWRAPAAGNVDDVLTYKGSAAAPVWQAVGAPPPAFHGALVGRSTPTSIPTSTWIDVPWNTELYDTDAIHDNVVNPDRLTIPAGWTRVRLDATITWDVSGTGSRQILFQKNGAWLMGIPWSHILASGNTSHGIHSPVVDCVAGDYFQFRVRQNSGIALNIPAASGVAHFAVQRIT